MAVSESSQQANRSGLDPRRLVVMFYLVAGIVLALFLFTVFLMFAVFSITGGALLSDEDINIGDGAGNVVGSWQEGNASAIDAAEKAYRVYAKKVPTQSGDYSMDHTALVYLMDKQGRFVAPFSLKRKPDEAAADLRRYM